MSVDPTHWAGGGVAQGEAPLSASGRSASGRSASGAPASSRAGAHATTGKTSLTHAPGVEGFAVDAACDAEHDDGGEDHAVRARRLIGMRRG